MVEPLYGLTDIDRRRTRDTIEDFEHRHRNPTGEDSIPHETIPSQFMRMVQPISWGEISFAIPVQAITREDGSTLWTPISDQQIQVRMVGGSLNRIDKGCYVHCILSSAGWLITSSWTMGYFTEVTRGIPFGCYAIRPNDGDGTAFQGHLKLSYPYEDVSDDGADIPGDEISLPWELDYCFGTQIDTTLSSFERSPLGPVIKGLGQQGFAGEDDGLNRLYPIQTHLPAWVAYDRQPDDSIPYEVLEGLGWGTVDEVTGEFTPNAAHPNENERWGPVVGPSFKIKRTAQVLPLYWWEWLILGQNEKQTITVTSAPLGHSWRYRLDGVYSSPITGGTSHPASVIETAIAGMSNVGSGNVDVTGPDGGPYVVEFIGDLAEQNINLGSFEREPSSSAAGTVVTTQAGSAELKRQFISPNGWWGDWGWAGWGWGGEYPYWSWWFSGISSSYWGGWGYGWWSGRWGGRPPSSTDIVFTGTDPPEPPEGTITRYCVHSYIVWQYGWLISSVNQDREICKIYGDLRFSRSHIIVNADIEDCPTYAAGGGGTDGTDGS